MKEPLLFRRNDCLTCDQALYWKDLLYRLVKIGTEVEFALPKGVRKDDVLPVLNDTGDWLASQSPVLWPCRIAYKISIS